MQTVNRGHVRRAPWFHDDIANKTVWGWAVYVRHDCKVAWRMFGSSAAAWEEAKRFYRVKYGKG